MQITCKKEYKDEKRAINATAVRNALEVNDFIRIEQTVPPFVVDYLRDNRDTVLHRISKMRERNRQMPTSVIQTKINELVEAISSFDKVVMYSLGINTQRMVKLLPDFVVDRMVYCDKAAKKETVYFNNKKVYKPSELNTTLKDYHIIVGSTEYGKEIYEEFLREGIDISRCTFNTISFYDQ